MATPKHSNLPRLAEAVSVTTYYLPPARWFVMGTDTTPTHYHLTSTHPQEIPETSWARYDGDPDSTKQPWPRRFKQVVKTALNIEALNDSRAEAPKDARAAVAYKFDEDTVLASIIRVQKGMWPETDSFRSLLGGGDLSVTAGWYSPSDSSLLVPEHAVTAGETVARNTVTGPPPIY